MGAHMCRRIAPRDRELSIPSLSYGDRSRFRRMERAGNGASGKRCDIDGVTRTGELAGVSESNRDIDGQPKGRGSGREYIALGSRRIDGKARRARVSVRGSAANQRVNCACWSFILPLLRTKLHFGLLRPRSAAVEAAVSAAM